MFRLLTAKDEGSITKDCCIGVNVYLVFKFFFMCKFLGPLHRGQHCTHRTEIKTQIDEIQQHIFNSISEDLNSYVVYYIKKVKA